jgi:Ni/Co efflux regulator RcnB
VSLSLSSARTTRQLYDRCCNIRTHASDLRFCPITLRRAQICCVCNDRIDRRFVVVNMPDLRKIERYSSRFWNCVAFHRGVDVGYLLFGRWGYHAIISPDFGENGVKDSPVKRLLSTSLAISMLTSPMALARQAPGRWRRAATTTSAGSSWRRSRGCGHQRPPQGGNGGGSGGRYQQPPGGYSGGGPGNGHQQPRPAGPGMHGPNPGTVWHRGDHFDVPAGRRQVVRGWHNHHGLYAPPPGQEWVQHGDQYLLVAITSGLIGAILRAAAASQ